MKYSGLNNNKEFLNYFIESNSKHGINRTGLKKIKFNKKSISVTLENNFYFVRYIVVLIYFVSVMFMLIYCLKYCWANNKKDSNGMNKVKISSEH